MKNEISEEIFVENLIEVLGYLWDDEKEDYENGLREDPNYDIKTHIFYNINQVYDYLKTTKVGSELLYE